MEGNDDIQEVKRRHKVGIDCLSLEEGDALLPSAEDEASDHLMYLTILKSLDSEREKFIALALDWGMKKDDIAFVLGIDPSRVTRWTQKIRIKLIAYRRR